MSKIIIPLMVLVVIVHGIIKKVNIYDTFIEGAKESFDMVFTIFPSILGMMLAINVLIDSNVLSNLFNLLGNLINIDVDLIPIGLMRSISGSASLALLSNIFSKHGPDSLIGLIASVIQGSSETTLYVITLYFGSIGIKKIRYALIVGILADLIAVLVSIIIIKSLF